LLLFLSFIIFALVVGNVFYYKLWFRPLFEIGNLKRALKPMHLIYILYIIVYLCGRGANAVHMLLIYIHYISAYVGWVYVCARSLCRCVQQKIRRRVPWSYYIKPAWNGFVRQLPVFVVINKGGTRPGRIW